MAEDLIFPRLVYRGAPDTLGTGQDRQGRQLDSQTKQVESKQALDEALKDGWRLTRDDGKPVRDDDRSAITIPAQTVITDSRDNPDAHARVDAKAAAAQAAADTEATQKGTKGLTAPAHNALGHADAGADAKAPVKK